MGASLCQLVLFILINVRLFALGPDCNVSANESVSKFVELVKNIRAMVV